MTKSVFSKKTRTCEIQKGVRASRRQGVQATWLKTSPNVMVSLVLRSDGEDDGWVNLAKRVSIDPLTYYNFANLSLYYFSFYYLPYLSLYVTKLKKK